MMTIRIQEGKVALVFRNGNYLRVLKPGFHFIGRDGASASPLNRIEVGFSPHFSADLPRRQMWLEATAAGHAPNTYRPLSAAPPADWSSGDPDFAAAGPGQPCSLGSETGYAERWSCAEGLECRSIAGAASGSVRSSKRK